MSLYRESVRMLAEVDSRTNNCPFHTHLELFLQCARRLEARPRAQELTAGTVLETGWK
jgi:hypothetical protein